MPSKPVSSSSVVSLWRYPIKSMMGEELNAAAVTERGLRGDRAYALIDVSSGKVVSAKNPLKWARMFDCRAAYTDKPNTTGTVCISLPDGTEV
ncbi:MAG: MOSC N-terminal beta barrel domain-containing protein, partial [Acidiferrobacterales bacterium]